MTYEDIIEGLENECDLCTEPYENCADHCYISQAIEELKKADKCKWHDLREDSEDYPPESGGSIPKSYDMVVVYNKGTDDEVTIQGQGWWNELWGEEGTGFIQIATQLTSVKLAHYPDKPIPFSREQLLAWRVIEPFESEV